MDKRLDLVECGRQFKRRIARHCFAHPVFAVADQTVKRYLNEDELRGVRDCICALLRMLEWNEGYVIFPVRRALTRVYADEDRILMLANSVVSTTLKYRSSLDESVTGLRSIVMSEFIQGLEWACSAVIRIGQVENELFVPLIATNERTDTVASKNESHGLPTDP